MSTRNKGEEPKKHRRNKDKHEDSEHLALQTVLDKTGLQPKDIEVGTHTEKQFVFVEK